jgi:hypothetical protein
MDEEEESPKAIISQQEWIDKIHNRRPSSKEEP